MEVMEWHPYPGAKNDLYAHGYRYENGTLVIIFRDHDVKGNLRITFPSPMAFRYTDELYQCAYNEVYRFGFNIAKGSSYLDWFRQTSGCESLNENVVHYAISTCSDCFEVITMTPPQVKWEYLDPKQENNHSPPPKNNLL